MSSCSISEKSGTQTASGKVRLYTSVPAAGAESIRQQFELDNPGITLEIVRAGTGNLMKMINYEAFM